MHELSAHDPAKLLDLLTARLAFEHMGVKLYEAIIEKLREHGEPAARRIISRLQAHCDEEKEHERWLEEQIHALGGNIHGTSEMADLESRDSKGIEHIVLDGENDPLHLFHALLAAEMADYAGWDLLVQLADQAGDRDAKKELEMRLHQEERHLLLVRRVVERLAGRVVLGEMFELPTWP